MNVRHLPVVDGDNHLIGMVSMRDLVGLQEQTAPMLH
jgi:CBS-domain-containing membrane protein